MSVIEQIDQMKQEGFKDSQIFQNLREQGFSPKQINEALEQSNIKSAVYNDSQQQGEMQPSIMPPVSQETEEPQFAEGAYSAATEEYSSQQMPQESYGLEQPGYSGYSEYGYQTAGAGTDIETITEISHQIVDEKLEKIKKQIQEISKIKTELQSKTENIDERLKRIEMGIDRLQTTILGKIGEYWRGISDLKEEMHATQESFSKVLTPLSENMSRLRKIARGEKMTKTESERGKPKAKTGKKGDGFERYLRE